MSVDLKINVKKSESLRLGINEDEELMLENENADQAVFFTNLGSIVSKDG